jgi:hypothetical protein
VQVEDMGAIEESLLKRYPDQADGEILCGLNDADVAELLRTMRTMGQEIPQPKQAANPQPEPAGDPMPARAEIRKQPPSTNHQPTPEPLSDNRFPGDGDITAQPPKAACASPPTSTPEATARLLAECTRAGIPAPAEDAIVQRWIRKAHTPTQVARACAEASTSFKAPKPMTSAYVDGILERIAADDLKAKRQADAKIAASEKLRQEQRERAKDAAPRPSALDKYVPKKSAA